MADEQLTWGEWEQPDLFGGLAPTFEDSIPSGADTATERAQPGVDGQLSLNRNVVDLYQIPTATSNPERPRTIAAKYEPGEKAVYVVMRPYHQRGGGLMTPIVKYSPVEATDWQNFRRAYSKGRYILLNWDGQIDYEEVSGMGGFDSFLITASNYAISQQKARDGLQEGQTEASDIYKKLRKAVEEGRKVSTVRLRSDRLGGTGRKKRQIKDLNEATASFYRNKPEIEMG